MNIIQCPQCKSENIWLSGYEDGGGDYGDDLTPWHECGDCGETFAQDEAILVWIHDSEEPEPRYFEYRDPGIPDRWEDIPF